MYQVGYCTVQNVIFYIIFEIRGVMVCVTDGIYPLLTY